MIQDRTQGNFYTIVVDFFSYNSPLKAIVRGAYSV